MLVKRQRLTDPATEPVSLAEAKAHLRVDGSDEDAVIEAMIGAARDYCESYCNRAWAESTWLYIVDTLPAGDDALWLPDPAVTSIASITYVDNNADVVTLTSSDYSLDAPRQELRPTDDWPNDANRIAISYTSAPASVPKAVKAAMLLVLTDLYEVRSASVVGVNIAANPAVKALLQPHRVEMGV